MADAPAKSDGTKFYDAAKRLHRLGHAPEFPEAGEPFWAWVFADFGATLFRRYQEHHRLPVTANLSTATREHLARPRCGHPDVMPLAGVSSWAASVKTLSYYQTIAYPGVDPAEVAADYAEATRRMAAVCGLTIGPASGPNSADVVATTGPIDGEWNVLALSELPPADAVRGTRLNQTFDQAEVGLTRDQRIAMMAHEFGHCLGLGHAIPGSGNLMEPVLSAIGSPQAGDTAELQARYGPPAAAPPAAGGTGPASPAPGPAAPGATPGLTAAAGPAAGTTLLHAAAPGTFTLTIDLAAAGDYLVLVVPR